MDHWHSYMYMVIAAHGIDQPAVKLSQLVLLNAISTQYWGCKKSLRHGLCSPGIY